MRRREFILYFGGAVALRPLAPRAQQSGKVFRTGVLGTTNVVAGKPYYDEFYGELARLGYREGRDVVYEARFAESNVDRLPALALELVSRGVDVIFAPATQPAAAAKSATRTIPIVTVATNIVALGLAASLARPGGNLTGVEMWVGDIVGKSIGLLKQMFPNLRRVATLGVIGHEQYAHVVAAAKVAARTSELQLDAVEIKEVEELDSAFARFAANGVEAVLISSHPIFLAGAERLGSAGLKHRIVTCSFYTEATEAGGFMSYNAHVKAAFRQAARYVDKILKGAAPADLPIEQATHFNLTINLKTAKALGIAVPPSILALADRVIE